MADYSVAPFSESAPWPEEVQTPVQCASAVQHKKSGRTSDVWNRQVRQIRCAASHNNLRETAGPAHQEKMKIASRLDRFLCLCDFDVLTHIGDCSAYKGLKIHLHAVLGANKAHYSETEFCDTVIYQDAHVTHVLMICFAKLSLHLFGSPSLSSSSCSLSCLVSDVFF